MVAALLLAAAAAASPFDEVVAAERGFAADSAARGLHEAFLAHLAPDSVVFDPVPVPGVPAHRGKAKAKGTLSWGPAWVTVARSGDLAVSSGPYEYRLPGADAPAPGTGWFLSIWGRRPDGAWTVRADLGVSCPLAYAPPAAVERGAPAAGPGKPLSRGAADEARARLATDERRLDAAAKEGIGAAVLARADEAVRVYREGRCPARGIAAARVALAADARALACSPSRVAIDATGGLGYAYGTCTDSGGGGKTGYLRVWRRAPDGSYKVLVDAVLDLPPPK